MGRYAAKALMGRALEKASLAVPFRLPLWETRRSETRERERERGGERRRKEGTQMSSVGAVASYFARRSAQKERVRLLYRRALKDTLNWAVHRHLFYQDVPSPLPLFSFVSRLNRRRSSVWMIDLA